MNPLADPNAAPDERTASVRIRAPWLLRGLISTLLLIARIPGMRRLMVWVMASLLVRWPYVVTTPDRAGG